jgi:hypothetical protein
VNDTGATATAGADGSGGAYAFNYSLAQGGGALHLDGPALFLDTTFFKNDAGVSGASSTSDGDTESEALAVGLAGGGGLSNLYGGGLTVNNGIFDQHRRGDGRCQRQDRHDGHGPQPGGRRRPVPSRPERARHDRQQQLVHEQLGERL